MGGSDQRNRTVDGAGEVKPFIPASDVCFSANNGLQSDIEPCPFCANCGSEVRGICKWPRMFASGTGLLCMPNLCDGAARAPHKNGGWSIGANAMRSVLAFGLLIALCASANAARVHHSKPRHVTVRPSQGVDPHFPPVLQDQTPSYDDPSKFGGG